MDEIINAITEEKAQTETQAPQATIAEPQIAESKEDKKWAEKMALLTKKEREIYQRERKFKELEAQMKRYQYLEDLKSKNPYHFLKEVGVDLESTLLAAAKDGEPPSVDDKISQLEKKIQDYERKMEEQRINEQKKAEEKAIEQFKFNMKKHIESKADEYELIVSEQAFDTVYDVIHEHFQKTLEESGQGEIMELDEAAKLVEDYLIERYKKAASTKKLSSLFAPQPTQQEQKSATFGQTISNTMTPSQTKSMPSRLESPDEAIRRIAMQFSKK